MKYIWRYKARVLSIEAADAFYLLIDLGFGISRVQYVRLLGDEEEGISLGEQVRLGREARDYVKDIMPRGSKVTIRTYRWGDERYLADIDIDGSDLAELIMESGHV